MRLAGYAGVGVVQVINMERGMVGGVTVRTLLSLGVALGVSVVDLVPGLAVRAGPEGGAVVVRRDRMPRVGLLQRKASVQKQIVRWLEERGGAAPACDVVAEFSKYQLSKAYLSLRAKEMGVVSRRSAVRAGSGARLWEWCLPGYVAAHPVASDSSSALDEVDAGGGAAVSPCCTTG